MAWKRRVALLRSLKKSAEAINSLTLLLDTFPNDTEAWAELADLYLSQDMLSQAAYCLEELILLQPFSHYMHVQYAEILWLQGKEASALKHWSRSVELCGDFLRGWFGIKTVGYGGIELISGDEQDSWGFGKFKSRDGG
jgi:tetratricopeptide (TPR) repeat protein